MPGKISHENHIIGITLRRYVGESGTFLRFIRISAVFRDIQNLANGLKSEGTEDVDSDSNSEEGLRTELNKRRKIELLCPEDNIIN